MADTFLLQKGELENFYNLANSKYQFIAPIRDKETRYEEIVDLEKFKEIDLENIPLYPAKYFFQSRNNVLFNFNNSSLSFKPFEVKNKLGVVLFGLRRCDLNSIYRQELVFTSEEIDPDFKAKMEKTILIGIQCKKGDEYCFCADMESVDYFDLMLYDKGNHFLVEVGSKKGQSFVKQFGKIFEPTKKRITHADKKIESSSRFSKKVENFSKYYEHPDWENGSKKCLSCTACNILCPSCYCFDMRDEVLLKKLNKGQRIRNIASCQLKYFTKVAGGGVFRKERIHRFKHRIYHQMQYFQERYDINLCTGCGRCIRGCPKRIDWVKIYNEMK